MSLNLQTLADRSRERYATPKGALPTKLDHAVEKKAATREDVRKLAAWSLAVKIRDSYKDRHTGKKVKGNRLALDPDSAHAHHIEPRGNWDTRYDLRNGICLSYATHDAVERNKLRIVGTRWFVENGRRYINAGTDTPIPVRFVEVK